MFCFLHFITAFTKKQVEVDENYSFIFIFLIEMNPQIDSVVKFSFYYNFLGP